MRLAICLIAGVLVAAHPISAQPKMEGQAAFGALDAARVLTVQGTTDIAVFAPVLVQFAETQPDLRILYEQWASNDLYQIADRACTGVGRTADLLISSSADQILKLVNDGCAQPYQSDQTLTLPPSLNWRNEIFGLTREPAVMVYNRKLVPPVDVPETRFDLIDLLRPVDSPYAGHVATYDIEASGLGYLFAFMDSLQATTYGSLLEAFGRSGAVATCCSAEIIDGVERGDYAIAYNVLGSYAIARASQNPDLAVVAPQDYTLLLSRAAMIPNGAANAVDAGRLIDFLLSTTGRIALTRAKLIVSDDETALFDVSGADALMRRIPLSPILLVGLDRAKRDGFLELWRSAFPKP